MNKNRSIYYSVLPTLVDESPTLEARWRDQDSEQLRVILFGDGSLCMATGTSIRRNWVELSAEQVDELVAFLARRREPIPETNNP